MMLFLNNSYIYYFILLQTSAKLYATTVYVKIYWLKVIDEIPSQQHC